MLLAPIHFQFIWVLNSSRRTPTIFIIAVSAHVSGTHKKVSPELITVVATEGPIHLHRDNWLPSSGTESDFHAENLVQDPIFAKP